MVLLNDVKMKYPGSRVETLRDIDLTIQDGEFVFLVGPSGSGKTTIIKLLTGEIRATGGRIEVNGFDLRTMKRRNLPKLRRSLGVIFQDYRLIKDMTVYENVAFAMRVVGASNREIRKRVPYVLDLVDLSGREDRYPRELSGGEQQRVAIARALVNSPDMIIADEPISALDVSIQAQILNILSDLRKELGLTILFIAHDLSVVKYFSNRVAVMNAGRIVELSSSREIYDAPMHDYTKSLLSAIPVPDPRVEKKRKRIPYDRREDYGPDDHPQLREVRPEHFVLMSDSEWEAYQKA